ncbi:MAG: histidine phosphatase family protein [Proteobacteria bacterium]|nr:histidine phosphatase family protein [Pseudomonadota bacterium]
MTVSTRWWWVRHAPVPNSARRIYGQDDVSADVSDLAAIEALAASLPAGAVWVASPLKRALQTAAAVTASLGSSPSAAPEPVIEPAIAEQHFGDWQGMSYDQLRDKLGPAYARVWQAPGQATPPGGESFEAVIERVGDAIERLTQAYRGRDIVAFGHGGSIRSALAHALGLDANAALSFRIECLSITRIDHFDQDDKDAASGGLRPWRVSGVNMINGARSSLPDGAKDRRPQPALR